MYGRVLITGGSGTLGHAIARRLTMHSYNVQGVTIFSRSEHRQAQMRRAYPHFNYILGDVRDATRIEAAIAGHDVVIHAAAMKRLPECDAQPAECYATNVQGSANVLRACIRHAVSKLVGISTDKACAATTAYGASKLMMEKLFVGSKTLIDTGIVRYGNVVASNGSVIPIWKDQALKQQELTVTRANMTRFWMAPSHAVDLIVKSFEADPGMIIVPMMKSLTIAQMADYVAPGHPIKEVGLRFQEKIHEDLVHKDELSLQKDTVIHVGVGEGGLSYNSYDCARLTREEFLTLLQEAETYDRE